MKVFGFERTGFVVVVVVAYWCIYLYGTCTLFLQRELVDWCVEPSQPLGATPGLFPQKDLGLKELRLFFKGLSVSVFKKRNCKWKLSRLLTVVLKALHHFKLDIDIH